MLITMDELFKRKNEYFKEITGDDGESDVFVVTVRIEARRERYRCMGEEDIKRRK